jgi:hypothetical protein
VPRLPRDLDQAVPVEHGVDRALGRHADVTGAGITAIRSSAIP